MLGLTAPAATAADDAGSTWSRADLGAYIAWAKQSLQPMVTPAAQQLLLAYYQRQRQVAGTIHRGTDCITVRFLEGLVRLSQAHARLMARQEVLSSDAAAVLLLLDSCPHVSSVVSKHFSAPAHSVCDLDDAGHAEVLAQLQTALALQNVPLLPPPAPPALPSPRRNMSPAVSVPAPPTAQARWRTTTCEASAPGMDAGLPEDQPGSQAPGAPARAHMGSRAYSRHSAPVPSTATRLAPLPPSATGTATTQNVSQAPACLSAQRPTSSGNAGPLLGQRSMRQITERCGPAAVQEAARPALASLRQNGRDVKESEPGVREGRAKWPRILEKHAIRLPPEAPTTLQQFPQRAPHAHTIRSMDGGFGARGLVSGGLGLCAEGDIDLADLDA